MTLLIHQDAFLTEMQNGLKEVETELNPDTNIGRAVLHNLQLRSRSAEWNDLDTALKCTLQHGKTSHPQATGRALQTRQAAHTECRSTGMHGIVRGTIGKCIGNQRRCIETILVSCRSPDDYSDRWRRLLWYNRPICRGYSAIATALLPYRRCP